MQCAQSRAVQSSQWDKVKELAPVATVNSLMSYFFNVTTAIAMAVAFFSLVSSMYANVREQTKEIGILRAMGMTRFRLYRVYVYEAYTLVFSSSILGLIIGSAVAYTMVLTQILFTQLPLRFEVNVGLLITVVGASMVGALVAAFGPVRLVVAQPVETQRGDGCFGVMVCNDLTITFLFSLYESIRLYPSCVCRYYLQKVSQLKQPPQGFFSRFFFGQKKKRKRVCAHIYKTK